MKAKKLTVKNLSQNVIANTILDDVQKEAMVSMNITIEEVIMNKSIYEFISRFVDIEYKENNYSFKEYTLDEIWIGARKIPQGTRQIIEEIGSNRLFLFFSPFAYTKNNGENFKKLYEILQAKAPFSSREFICDGLISQRKKGTENSDDLYDSKKFSAEINDGNFPREDTNDFTLFPNATEVIEYQDESNLGEAVRY